MPTVPSRSRTHAAADGPLGVVLAGGAGSRVGGEKAMVLLDGRPLAVWAVDALRAAGLAEVVVVAKADTALPDGVTAWAEPDEPRHPLAGVAYALGRAGDRAVVTLPVDVPLAPPAVLARLAASEGAAVVRAGGRLCPLVARWPAGTSVPAAGRATEAILSLDPLVLDVDAAGFENLNTPADLAALSRR